MYLSWYCVLTISISKPYSKLENYCIDKFILLYAIKTVHMMEKLHNFITSTADSNLAT